MDKALIDTSILLEPFIPWKNKEPNYKSNTLALLNGNLTEFHRRFQPVVSLSVLGELNLILSEKIHLIKGIEKTKKKEEMDRILEDFFFKCEKTGLKKETFEIADNLIKFDDRLDPLDTLHISTAIVEGCKTFIFIDYKLKDNRKVDKYLKEKYGLFLTPFNIPKNEDSRKPNQKFTWVE